MDAARLLETKLLPSCGCEEVTIITLCGSDLELQEVAAPKVPERFAIDEPG
jgi:hypothetical protein